MAKVTSIETKLQAKRSKEELERWKAFFVQQFKGEDAETLAKLYKAIQEKDQAAYMEIANAVVMRQGMKELNKEGSGL